MDEQSDKAFDSADPAQRAGSLVAEHINSVIDAAERQAHEALRDAERDAEATRREALDSAQRVFERIDELERPLREFVQNLRLETERVERELAGHVDGEATTIPSESGSDTAALSQGLVEAVEEPVETDDGEPVEEPLSERVEERAEETATVDGPIEEKPAKKGLGGRTALAERLGGTRPAGKKPAPKKRAATKSRATAPSDQVVEDPDEQASTPEAEHSIDADKVTANGEERVAAEPPPTNSTSSSAVESGPAKLANRLLARLRDGGADNTVFITTEGHCSVCQKTFMAGSEEDLEQSGWKVSGDVGLCPECQSDAWQLPDGARLPFRRGGG